MPIFVRKELMYLMKRKDLSGLGMKDGRLVSDRPCGVTGIQQAVDLRRSIKREQKIEMMVEADVRASMREKMLGYE